MNTTEHDWRYTDHRMALRTNSLNILFKKFGHQLSSDGTPKYTNESIYECVHDWVSQGNLSTYGIAKYYEVYYS